MTVAVVVVVVVVVQLLVCCCARCGRYDFLDRYKLSTAAEVDVDKNELIADKYEADDPHLVALETRRAPLGLYMRVPREETLGPRVLISTEPAIATVRT